MKTKDLPASVAWPKHWRNVPVWAVFERVKDVGHPDEEMLSVYREHGVIRKSSRDDNANQTAENRNIYQLVDDGWLIVNRMKAWQGSVGISPLRGIVSGHYLCFRPQHCEDSRFLNWLLRSKVYATEYARISRGVRPGQIEIDNDELRMLRIALPPVDEQRRIADFLDVRTARIGQLVALQSRISELQLERADGRISELVRQSQLVCRDGSECAPVRRLLKKHNHPTKLTGEIITVYRDGQVTSRGLRRAEGYTLSASAEPQGQGVEFGDVVVHGLDGFAGAIGDSEAVGNCSPVNHVCTPIDGGDPTFYGRLLRVLATGGYLGLFASSTRERAVDLRSWELFGSIPIPCVDPRVQRDIGRLVAGVRPLREEVLRFNALLAERREALITAAVTGQIDVTTARGVAV